MVNYSKKNLNRKDSKPNNVINPNPLPPLIFKMHNKRDSSKGKRKKMSPMKNNNHNPLNFQNNGLNMKFISEEVCNEGENIYQSRSLCRQISKDISTSEVVMV